MRRKTNILSQTSWWMVNKSLVKKLGLEPTLLLTDLISKQEFFEEKKMLDEQGFFFNEKSKIEEDTTLSPHMQDVCMTELKNLKLVETNKYGRPQRLYYRVNIKMVNKLISKLHT